MKNLGEFSTMVQNALKVARMGKKIDHSVTIMIHGVDRETLEMLFQESALIFDVNTRGEVPFTVAHLQEFPEIEFFIKKEV